MNPMEARILDELRTIVDGRGLISSSEELKTYECDGLTNFRVQPRAVLLPTCTEQVQTIIRICHRERIPFVEPGVINLDVTGRVAPQEYFYAPDPSSQSICSIGGNVAENSGGAHCLKYGFTTTHVLGLEVVLPDGSLVHLGGKTLDTPGYDLTGVFVGSE